MSALSAKRVQSAYPRSIHRTSSNVQDVHVKQRSITSMDTHQSHTDVFDLPVPAWRTVEPSTSSKIISNHQRSATSMDTHQSHTDVFDLPVPAWRTLESSTSPKTISDRQRPATSMDTHRSHTDVFDLPVPAWRTLEPSTSSRTISNRQRPKTGRNGSRSSISTQLFAEKIHSDEIADLVRSLDRDDKVIVQVDCLANYRKLVQTINLRQRPLDWKLLCTLQQRENRIIQRNACRDIRYRSLLDTLQPKHIIQVQENQSNDANQKNISHYQADDNDIKY